MKNIFLLLLILSFLPACSWQKPNYVIGVSQCSEDEWRTKLNKELIREALFYDGVQVEIRSVKDNTEQQIQDIRKFMEQGIDLLIIAPNEATPLTPVIEEVYDRGIPVVLVDRTIFSDKYTAYLSADNFEIGRAVGEYIVNYTGGKGKVVELSGLSGSTPATDRHQGFSGVISRSPGIELLGIRDAGWLKEEAVEQMTLFLEEFPEIDLVFAQNDRMAAGAYEAAQKAGREKEMKFIGIDAVPGDGYGIDQVLEGTLDATFIYPTEGDRVMQTAMAILLGEPFERENILYTAVVDKTNARIMNLQTQHINQLDRKIEVLNSQIDMYLARFANQRLILYAVFTILLLLLIVVVIIVKAYRVKHRLNRQLEEQRDQLIHLSRQLEEATHAKLVFFTNISHDFRTPLTLIADPVDQLLADSETPEKQKSHLKLVKKNVQILLRLVNQILDFRRYENGKMDLHLVHTDFKEQLEEWIKAFTPVARHKHIRLSFDIDPEKNYHISIDPEKIERVFYNLLSNAFKFTPENGKINIHLSRITKENKAYACLTVSDTGPGIPEKHIRNIFDRFYKTDYQHSGSGIGLALAKAFIDLHNGEIQVESTEGKGTTFIILVPIHQSGSTEGKIISTATKQEEINLLLTETNEVETIQPEASGETLLIIDDNKDIRDYIRSFLEKEFTILEASNGKEGLRMARKHVPDLIICDVMMPLMDGIECCSRIKQEMQTSHIPVILLTACSLDEQRIKGFETGADSYISKPFNSKVLEARIHNLIRNRKQLKQFFGDNQSLSKETISTIDKDFVEKFRALINENLSNSEINVEELGQAMGMSRVQLYRKVKSLTNYSPNELLRISRLKKAASLLAASDMSISEISYEVGFTSPSYFTKCYREYFGLSPTDYLKRK